MNPIELVERDVNRNATDASFSVREQPEQCPFVDHRLFVAYGPSKRFDFTTLPHGSLGYYVADGTSATRLTRNHKEIDQILAAEWSHLPDACPIRLASLILRFYDGGIRASHHVLGDADALANYANSERPIRDYKFNDAQLAKARPSITPTTSSLDGDTLVIHALTLCGWMHDKRNLGIETISVRSDGHPNFAARNVLSRKIFSRVPALRY